MNILPRPLFQFLIIPIGLSLILLSPSYAKTEKDKPMNDIDRVIRPEKKQVLVLTTGGTIAGSATTDKLEYKAGNTKGEDLVASIPALQNMAKIHVDPVAQIGSQDMSDTILLKLAKKVQAAENNPSISGIVITHGTDTMEETAFFLDKLINSKKPIILTGAMRPTNFISSDGASNLVNAVKLATRPEAYHQPVMIVMNDMIYDAHSVQKSHTTSLQTFQSPNTGPIGIINNDHVYFYRTSSNARKHIYAIPEKAPFPRVEIIYSHIQMDGDLIHDAVKRGAKGIILAGVGDGNTSTQAIQALKEVASKGVIVVRSSRTGSGFVNRNVEVNDDANKFIAAADLNPQKARILLQLILANKINELDTIQQLFYEMN